MTKQQYRHPLWQLTLMRWRMFVREPAAVFWSCPAGEPALWRHLRTLNKANIPTWAAAGKDAPESDAERIVARVPWSRQLDKVKDAQLIADYSRPEFVLAGWKPRLEFKN